MHQWERHVRFHQGVMHPSEGEFPLRHERIGQSLKRLPVTRIRRASNRSTRSVRFEVARRGVHARLASSRANLSTHVEFPAVEQRIGETNVFPWTTRAARTCPRSAGTRARCHELLAPTSASAASKLHSRNTSALEFLHVPAARPSLTELSGALSMEQHRALERRTIRSSRRGGGT